VKIPVVPDTGCPELANALCWFLKTSGPRAGYSPATARQQASENLSKPDIAAAVAESKRKQLAAADLSAARVLEKLRQRVDGSKVPVLVKERTEVGKRQN